MPLHRAAAPLALIVTALLAGCTAQAPDPTPTATPSSEPFFASEEEALAAAEEVFANYLNSLNMVLEQGGEYADELEGLASPDVIEQQKVGFAQYVENGYFLAGKTRFDYMRLQAYRSDAAPGRELLSVYVCRDVSQTDVVDQNQRSVVPEDRDLRLPFEVGFSWSAEVDGLVVSKDEQWTDQSFC